jgi:hypothetical protein
METLTVELNPDFKLRRNLAGRLQFTAADNNVHDGAFPVRAFPITAPEESISLLSQEGHELAWINRLSDLQVEVRTLIEEELAQREFMPEIRHINHVSSFATPSTWEVETDRGSALLILKSEDHIRRLAHSSLLISDSHGVNFLIRDIDQLDNHSRKLLDRFL